MKRRLVVVSVLAFGVCVMGGGAPLAGPMHGGPSLSALCRRGTTYSDGCAGAPVDGAVQFPNFFSDSTSGYVRDGVARQSNQTYTTRPPWNVAGVEYPVGYSVSAMYKDPANIQTDPKTNGGCEYYATGANGGPIVECNHVFSVDIEGYDFSLHGCTILEIKNNMNGGPIVIRNNNFKNAANCVTWGYIASVDNGNTGPVTFSQNKVDGDALNVTSSVGGIDLNTSGPITAKYNAFLRLRGRPIGTNTAEFIDVEFNYVEGFIYAASDGHGELVTDASASLATEPFQLYRYNTVLEPANVDAGGLTAAIWLTTSNAGQTLAYGLVEGNTTIVNTATGTAGAAAVEIQDSTYPSVVIRNNYVDGIGANHCFQDSTAGYIGQAGWLTGNLNLRTNAAINSWNSGSC